MARGHGGPMVRSVKVKSMLEVSVKQRSAACV